MKRNEQRYFVSLSAVSVFPIDMLCLLLKTENKLFHSMEKLPSFDKAQINPSSPVNSRKHKSNQTITVLTVCIAEMMDDELKR